MIRLRFQSARDRVHAWERAWWILSPVAMQQQDPIVLDSWEACSSHARLWRAIESSLHEIQYREAMLRLRTSLN